MRALQLGPARDLNRVRTPPRGGDLRVEGRRLLFVGDDGKQVMLTLDDAEAMRQLADWLELIADDVAMTDMTRAFRKPDEFLSDKLF